MSPRPDVHTVDAELLGRWPLPDPGDDKNSRGRVVVVGGSESSPGALLLSGLAALRVGAGRLSIVAPEPVALPLAVAVPEAGLFSFDARGRLSAGARAEIETADAVLVGPGLGDPGLTERIVRAVDATRADRVPLVLDAFALGILPALGRRRPRAPLLLNPNLEETALLLGREIDDLAADVVEIAGAYSAVVTSHACVGTPDGQVWRVPDAGPGLGTSGSGDVLAGAMAGFAARGVHPTGAAVWAASVHASAGARLARRIAPLGYLARELCAELPGALASATEGR